MKLTQKEIEFFRAISSTEMGRFLHEYAERVRDHAFDSRNWPEGVTKESAQLAANLIEELIVNKIRPKAAQGQIMNQPYE